MTTSTFYRTLSSIRRNISGVAGWLTDREVEFLALIASCPTAGGDVLEIGSFRGRSTIALALAMRQARTSQFGQSHLVAVDPMLDDDPLMQRAGEQGSARREFEANLRDASVRHLVEFHETYSYELAKSWNRPLRLLWIDGDHTYPSTKQDFDLFAPFLADGAILAMHDVLSRYDGCIRVFTEDVLTSPHFGAAGVCGSIGWAQYWHEPHTVEEEQRNKQRLSEQLSRLIPYHLQTEAPKGLQKLRYKWLRSRVPHQAIDPNRWQAAVTGAENRRR